MNQRAKGSQISQRVKAKAKMKVASASSSEAEDHRFLPALAWGDAAVRLYEMEWWMRYRLENGLRLIASTRRSTTYPY